MNKKQSKLIALLILLMICYNTKSQNIKEDPNLQAAFQAHGALNLKQAKSYFEKVIENKDTSNKDRCEALRQVAIIEWKHYKNYNNAKRLLVIADSIGDYRSESWLVMLRVEVESKNYEKAFTAGEKAIDLAESEADKNYSKYRYSKAILHQALEQFYTNKPFNDKLISKAAILLEEVLQSNPTHVNAADVLLGISLLRKDGANALKSWLAYYRFNNPESAYGYLKPSAVKLNQLITKWNSEALNISEKNELIETIGNSRFYKYVKILAKHFNIEKSVIVEYADYMEAIKALTNEYYRLVSINKSDSGFLSSLRLKNEEFYNKIKAPTEEPFDANSFRNYIRSKFGSVLIVSSTSASRQVGLVYGHIVNERIRNIEQYGKSADFTFTELDMMISNGYPSWFWEDRGAGGYALRGGFLRIKTMFKYLAISAWEKVTDSVKRQKIETSIQTNLLDSNVNTDIKVIRVALAKKIELDALDNLYNTLKASGLEGLELQLKFIETYELYRDNATMFAHEGRHSIDRVVLGQEAYRTLGSQVIEYRGRLSQIAFSESPKLELSNMLSGVSSTPTGQSNKMICDVYETWITNNSDSIVNYNTNQKPLAQLYKLTDAQLISIIQSVDPFYKEYIKDKN